MDAKIIQHQVPQIFKRRPLHPVVIPMNRQVRRDRGANYPFRYRVPQIRKVRRPAAILVHREPDALLLRQIDQTLTCIQVRHERLLREHVLLSRDRSPHDRDALGGMRRHIDHLDVVTPQHVAIVGVRRRCGIKLLLPPPRLGLGAITQRRDVIPRGLVRAQVILRDAAATDQADLRVVSLRILGEIRHRGRFDALVAAGLCQGIIALFRHRDLTQPTSGTVRRSFALRTAESTICWPMREIGSDSGPSIGSPVSMQCSAY